MANQQATVSFIPPVDDGGSPIIDYAVTSSPGSITATGNTSPITITGLTNGISYTFTVHARNVNGPGPEGGPSNAVIPAGSILISLTPLQILMCSPLATMTASLTGNPAGHTFWWEQISGTDVDWGASDRTQLSVSWAWPVVRDDKIFKFWVDYGTPEQQFSLTTISSTPQDNVGETTFAGSRSVPSAANQMDILPVTTFPLGVPNYAKLYQLGDPTSITWSVPTDTSNIVGIALEENLSGSYTQIYYASNTSTNNTATVNPITGTYRYRIDFKGSKSVYTSSFRPVLNYPILGDDAYTGGMSVSLVPSLRSSLLVSRITFVSDDTVNISSGSTGLMTNSSSTTLYTKGTIGGSGTFDGSTDDTAAISSGPGPTTFSSSTTLYWHSTVGG